MRHVSLAAALLIACFSQNSPAIEQACDPVPVPACINYYAECYRADGSRNGKVYKEDVLQLLYWDFCATTAYRVINQCGFTVSIMIPHGETSEFDQQAFHDLQTSHFLHTSYEGKVGLVQCCADRTEQCLE